MERSKIVAIITGTFTVLLAIAYLCLVQILDFRGEMVPAPLDLGQLSQFLTNPLYSLPTSPLQIL
ncbi:MAG: hypothetical protein AAF215_11475 [Cyanobacteria bacterium P01_A01_bin.123]